MERYGVNRFVQDIMDVILWCAFIEIFKTERYVAHTDLRYLIVGNVRKCGALRSRCLCCGFLFCNYDAFP